MWLKIYHLTSSKWFGFFVFLNSDFRILDYNLASEKMKFTFPTQNFLFQVTSIRSIGLYSNFANIVTGIFLFISLISDPHKRWIYSLIQCKFYCNKWKYQMNSFMEIIHLHVKKYSGIWSNGILLFRSYKTLPLTSTESVLKTILIHVSYSHI